LGGVIYSGIGEILNPTSFSLIERDVDQTLHLNTLDDFPGESIGGVYYTLITESKSPEKR
jgi:ubiquinone biosynthesis protein Coq4